MICQAVWKGIVYCVLDKNEMESVDFRLFPSGTSPARATPIIHLGPVQRAMLPTLMVTKVFENGPRTKG